MKYFWLALYTVAVVATSTFVAVAAVQSSAPWRADLARAQVPAHTHTGDQLSLNWDTPVVREWITGEGEKIGTDSTTTLYEYTDVSQEVLSSSLFRRDISEIILKLTSDPEMRGHLIRHGLSEKEIDAIARHFDGTTTEQAQFLAYTERRK
jgi:hypothetical protein